MAKGKILVADDEKHIVSILECGFRTEGYEVVIAGDGEQAVERVRCEKPDIVVMDVMMPKMDGYEACRIIKSDPKTQNVRVIMLTAKGRVGDAQRGLDAGADLYVTKPFSLPQLIEFVHSVAK